MTTRAQSLLLFLVILAAAFPVCCWGPARADVNREVNRIRLTVLGSRTENEPARVDAGQLCRVQNTIRWRERVWTAGECQRIAAALNATMAPIQTLAMAINESDLRERAINVSRPGVYDLGLMQVRCVTLGAVAEEIGSLSANTEATTTPTIPRDRCTNGAARGLYAHQLLDPVINIRTADAVLASHGGSLLGYSGSTKERGYGARVSAIVAALGGIEVKVRGARLRKLVRQIVEAMKGEPKS